MSVSNIATMQRYITIVFLKTMEEIIMIKMSRQELKDLISQSVQECLQKYLKMEAPERAHYGTFKPKIVIHRTLYCTKY